MGGVGLFIAELCSAGNNSPTSVSKSRENYLVHDAILDNLCQTKGALSQFAVLDVNKAALKTVSRPRGFATAALSRVYKHYLI